MGLEKKSNVGLRRQRAAAIAVAEKVVGRPSLCRFIAAVSGRVRSTRKKPNTEEINKEGGRLKFSPND